MRRFDHRAILCTLLGGCFGSGPRYVPDADRNKDLPSDVDELIRLADRMTDVRLAEKPPPLSTTDRALAALERAVALGPKQPFEVYWRLSRACFMMTEGLDDKVQFHAFARRGVDYAQRARSLAPRRVEPHYFLALNTAKVAEATANAHLIQSIIEPAEQAMKIDEKYDDAGPLRILGKVYLTAPAWPVSVGSPEKAIDMLRRAVALAAVPLNRIFLGEAYYHDEEYDLAEKLIRQALSDGQANRLGERWKKEAQDYLNRIAAGDVDDPRTNF